MSATFEIKGFYEDVFDDDAGKCIGTRPARDDPSRGYGANSARSFVATEPFVIERARKRVLIKASPQKPRRLTTYLQKICGRMLPPS